MRLPNKQVHVRISEELLVKMDALCRHLDIDRSELIRQSVVEKLRQFTPDALPGANGFNILATDEQLDELDQIIKNERRRRGIRYWPR